MASAEYKMKLAQPLIETAAELAGLLADAKQVRPRGLSGDGGFGDCDWQARPVCHDSKDGESFVFGDAIGGGLILRCRAGCKELPKTVGNALNARIQTRNADGSLFWGGKDTSLRQPRRYKAPEVKGSFAKPLPAGFNLADLFASRRWMAGDGKQGATFNLRGELVGFRHSKPAEKGGAALARFGGQTTETDKKGRDYEIRILAWGTRSQIERLIEREGSLTAKESRPCLLLTGDAKTPASEAIGAIDFDYKPDSDPDGVGRGWRDAAFKLLKAAGCPIWLSTSGNGFHALFGLRSDELGGGFWQREPEPYPPDGAFHGARIDLYAAGAKRLIAMRFDKPAANTSDDTPIPSIGRAALMDGLANLTPIPRVVQKRAEKTQSESEANSEQETDTDGREKRDNAVEGSGGSLGGGQEDTARGRPLKSADDGRPSGGGGQAATDGGGAGGAGQSQPREAEARESDESELGGEIVALLESDGVPRTTKRLAMVLDGGNLPPQITPTQVESEMFALVAEGFVRRDGDYWLADKAEVAVLNVGEVYCADSTLGVHCGALIAADGADYCEAHSAAAIYPVGETAADCEPCRAAERRGAVGGACYKHNSIWGGTKPREKESEQAALAEIAAKAQEGAAEADAKHSGETPPVVLRLRYDDYDRIESQTDLTDDEVAARADAFRRANPLLENRADFDCVGVLVKPKHRCGADCAYKKASPRFSPRDHEMALQLGGKTPLLLGHSYELAESGRDWRIHRVIALAKWRAQLNPYGIAVLDGGEARSWYPMSNGLYVLVGEGEAGEINLSYEPAEQLSEVDPRRYETVEVKTADYALLTNDGDRQAWRESMLAFYNDDPRFVRLIDAEIRRESH